MLVKWDLNKPDEGTMLAKAKEPIYCIHEFAGYLLLGLRSGAIHVVNQKTNEETRQLLISSAEIFCMTSTSKYLYVGTGNGVLYQLDSNFKVVSKVQLSSRSLRCLHLFQNSLFVGGTDHHLYQLDLDLNLKQSIKAHDETIFSIANSQHELITGGKDARIKFFNTDLKQVKSIDAHWLHVKFLDMHPDLNLLISSSMDKTIRIWDSSTKDLLKVIDKEKFDGHSSSVNCVLWLNKNTVISCSDDRVVMAFKIEIK